MLDKAVHMVSLPENSIPKKDWDEATEGTRLSYIGQVVERAVELTWEQLEPALPDFDHCASIDAEALAEGECRDVLADPMGALDKLHSAKECPRAGRNIIRAGHHLKIAKGLLARGLVIALEAHERIFVHGQPLMNGLFGIGKGAFLGEEAGDMAGLEILRLIMNLTASNLLRPAFGADIESLPHAGLWRAILLEAEEVLMWSYEDLKGAFYLFKLRPEWAKVFCFDMEFDATELGVPGSGPRWIGAVTLPMGWLSAMGIAQPFIRSCSALAGASQDLVTSLEM
jgi:hypothetical protein